MLGSFAFIANTTPTARAIEPTVKSVSIIRCFIAQSPGSADRRSEIVGALFSYAFHISKTTKADTDATTRSRSVSIYDARGFPARVVVVRVAGGVAADVLVGGVAADVLVGT